MRDDAFSIVCVGVACVDRYFTLPKWPTEGSAEVVSHFADMMGGMVANAAAVFAGYGYATYLLDIMNRSPATEAILAQLEEAGVDTSYVQRVDSLPDAQCLIFSSSKDRTILVVDSQKPHYRLDDRTMDLLRSVSCVYTTLHDFRRFDDPPALADALSANGVCLAFDVEEERLDDMDRMLLSKAAVLCFNQYGFHGFAGEADEGIAIRDLLEAGVQAISITLGSDGCRCYTPLESVALPAAKVKVVDTTGAGDTFNSSFVSCVLRGLPLRKCCMFAVAAAAHAVEHVGPRAGVQLRSAVEAQMEIYDREVSPCE